MPFEQIFRAGSLIAISLIAASWSLTASAQQGARLMQMFERLDSDGDGAVALSDLPERLQTRLGEADRNDDGNLDRREISQLMRRFRERSQNPRGDRPPRDARPGGKAPGDDLREPGDVPGDDMKQQGERPPRERMNKKPGGDEPTPGQPRQRGRKDNRNRNGEQEPPGNGTVEPIHPGDG